MASLLYRYWNIAFQNRICYNATRQREIVNPYDSAITKTPVLQHWGFLFPFYAAGLNGYRLFIAIQPFDDVMANYTSRDGDNKRNNELHMIHLLSVTRFGGGNREIIA